MSKGECYYCGEMCEVEHMPVKGGLLELYRCEVHGYVALGDVVPNVV